MASAGPSAVLGKEGGPSRTSRPGSPNSSRQSSYRGDQHSHEQEEQKQEGEDYELYDFGSEGESKTLLPTHLLPSGRAVGKKSRSSESPQRKSRSRPLLLIFGACMLPVGLLVIAYLFLGESLPFYTSSASPNSANLYIPEEGEEVPSWKLDVVDLASDPTHLLLPIRPAPAIHLLEPLRDRLPYPILSEYFIHGRLPSSLTHGNAPSQHPLDLVYLFVNASSPYWQREFDARSESEGIKAGKGSGQTHHWRDNGELRGAVRSGYTALGAEAGHIHIITADWPVLPGEDEALGVEPGEWKISQIAEWLDWESQKREGRLKWHFHSELFQLPKDGDKVVLDRDVPLQQRMAIMDAQSHGQNVSIVDKWESEEAWKKETLPSFNSFSIEQRLAWIEGLSENFVAFNDDMFLLRSLSTSDFRHPLLGNLIRFDPGLLVPKYMQPKQLSDSGEWGGLQHANGLLAARFYPIKRFYMHHLPKTQSRVVLHEASIMWSAQLSLASSRGFRESRRGEGDVEMSWLITHLRVERWREALLWSWIVGKVGGVSGIWGEDEKQALRKVLGLRSHEGEGMDQVTVKRGDRKTLEDLDKLMLKAGWEGPKATQYTYTSMDGHLPSSPASPASECTFDLKTCLPPTFLNTSDTFVASELFTHISFKYHECGNCLIDALVKASGQRGLSAFIPDEDQIFYPAEEDDTAMWRRSEPVLPMVPIWKDGDFSVEANVKRGQDVWDGIEAREDGGVSLRAWSIKLLSKYNYVYGETPARFTPIRSFNQLSSELRAIDTTPELALLCLNDDQTDKGSSQFREKFGTWMEGRWGGEIEGLDWERKNVSWLV